MTPLAMRLLKLANAGSVSVVDPAYKNEANDLVQIAKRLVETHCFEMTSIEPLIREFADHHFPHNLNSELMFWPAEKIWLELGQSGNVRRSALFVEVTGKLHGPANCSIITAEENGEVSHRGTFLYSPGGIINDSRIVGRQRIAAIIAAQLSAINQPKIINRRVHQPHAGLARKLARAQGMAGKFPLRAWTELTLEAFTTRDEGGKIIEQGASGSRKCLHFVRAHIRPSTGAFVASYWRGDPSLGIKRTRYNLVPPKMRLAA